MSFGVSTRGFYDRSTSVMTGLQKQADKAMVQISTGKRLQVPSDDPVAYQRLQVLRRASADEAVYGATKAFLVSFAEAVKSELKDSGVTGIAYETVDITQDADARDRVMSLGYLQAPVVMVDDDEHWSGFRLDRIKALSQRSTGITA